VQVGEQAIVESVEVPESLVGEKPTGDQVAPLPAESEPINTAPLDLFPVFLQRLIVFLGSASRTDEEIRIALGLERSQVKVWLAAAVSGGHVEKLKKPVVYALPKQKSLC
jgi:hypothetical protein